MLYSTHIEIWKFTNLMRKQKKKHQNARSTDKKLKPRVWCSLFHFFHVVCKISHFNTWTAKHLAQASCTKFTVRFFREKSTEFKPFLQCCFECWEQIMYFDLKNSCIYCSLLYLKKFNGRCTCCLMFCVNKQTKKHLHRILLSILKKE